MMGTTYSPDVDVIGSGGGFGGLGGLAGGSGGFLTLLILFGLFGGGFGNGFGNKNQDTGAVAGSGVLAGETQAKLDCLSKGQSSIEQQIAFNRSNDQFAALGSQITDLAGIQRDATFAVTQQNNDLSRQLASCCCDIKVGQQALATDMAMQTATLQAAGLENTQKILDKISDTQIQALQTENNRLVNAANTNSVIAAILAQCGSKSSCSSSGGINIDVNALARAAQAQGQQFMPAMTTAQPVPTPQATGA